jgi:4'-phosphopantetheinyl transferase
MRLRKDMWQRLPDPVIPMASEIDIWRIDLNRDPASVDSLFELLSADERARADRFVFAKDRLHFIVGRGSLRKILGGYLGIPPEDISFSVRHYGKPYLSSDCHGLRFNLSHSRGTAIIAISRDREVGVDIEFVDRNFDFLGVAPSVFSADEVARIRSLPAELQAERFFAAWTRKEALLKAMGDGFSTQPELQSAIPALVEENLLSFKSRTGDEWSVISLDSDEGFKIALAVEGELAPVRHRQFPTSATTCHAIG